MRSVVAFLAVATASACFESKASTAPPESGAAPPPQRQTQRRPPRTPKARPETRVVVDAPRDYFDKKILALTADHRVVEGNFTLNVLPVPLELHIAGQYREWEEKRLTPEQMLTEINAAAPAFSDSVFAMLTIMFVGDVLSPGRTQFEIPDDIAEYIFMENDRGEAIRCSRAILPLMHMPGPFTKAVNVNLEFANIREQNPSFFETKSLRFVVGGLDFRSNTVSYRYPFGDMFGDAPEALRTLYRDAGVWP